jgi:hypothetical protein
MTNRRDTVVCYELRDTCLATTALTSALKLAQTASEPLRDLELRLTVCRLRFLSSRNGRRVWPVVCYELRVLQIVNVLQRRA